jgi:hypothetical protein
MSPDSDVAKDIEKIVDAICPPPLPSWLVDNEVHVDIIPWDISPFEVKSEETLTFMGDEYSWPVIKIGFDWCRDNVPNYLKFRLKSMVGNQRKS